VLHNFKTKKLNQSNQIDPKCLKIVTRYIFLKTNFGSKLEEAHVWSPIRFPMEHFWKTPSPEDLSATIENIFGPYLLHDPYLLCISEFSKFETQIIQFFSFEIIDMQILYRFLQHPLHTLILTAIWTIRLFAGNQIIPSGLLGGRWKNFFASHLQTKAK